MTRKRKITNPFVSIKASGLLLPVDLLVRVRDRDKAISGLESSDYHLSGGQKPQEAAATAWNNCQAAWQEFRRKLAALPASDAGTSLTRDEWLLPLFKELGYGQLQTKRKLNFDEREYPVSHGWDEHVPIHLLSARYDLDKRTPGVAGAAKQSPYSMVQELLNRSATHRWGFVSNGLKLYVLRDNISLARASNLLFDLEAMMEGNAYWDFVVLYMICHQSRVEILDEESQDKDKDYESTPNPENCWLERWAKLADEQGVQARETMRVGVEAAINSLGAGFLSTKGNAELRRRMGDPEDEFDKQKYYHQLLRIIYRLIMLFVAEEKKNEDGSNLFHPPNTPDEIRDLYLKYYSVSRLRQLAQRRGTSHGDVYESLKILFEQLRDGYEPLGIPGLGSLLFSSDSTPELDNARISNEALLDAIRHLCYTDDKDSRRPVDFGNLGAEELGSVYESLLELHPIIDSESGPFKLGTAAGSERKTTGSYYTPTSLVNCLLDSALDPVIERAKEAVDAEAALLDLKICDPACGSGHFLIAAAERIATHLARLRTGDDQPSTLPIQHAKRDVIANCIYGVDMNDMAVELCKVSLWMETLEPGKPLSFLTSHIQCGNSLIGATPRLLAGGIPDDAFKPVEGDDRALCTELKRDNKREREEYERGYRDFNVAFNLGSLATEFAKLGKGADSPDAVRQAELAYADLIRSANYENAKLLADMWCSVFMWRKSKSNEELEDNFKQGTSIGTMCPTFRDFRKFEATAHSLTPEIKTEIVKIAEDFNFFHWHLAFPEIFHITEVPDETESGWMGGFDAILGNPPWEKINFRDEEYFAASHPEIASAPNKAKRKKLIEKLASEDPSAFSAYETVYRKHLSVSSFLRFSGLYPFTGLSRINLYSVFCELAIKNIALDGRVGMVLASGIATDDNNKLLFSHLVEHNRLVSVFDFENRNGLFPGVHRSYKFCLFTAVGEPQEAPPVFAFYLGSTAEIQIEQKRFELSFSDLCRINPSTHTAPTFRDKRDASCVSYVYSRYDTPCASDFTVKPKTPFNSANDSELFVSKSTLTQDNCIWRDFHIAESGASEYLPVYESKLIHQFNHRYATFEDATDREVKNGNANEVTATCLSQPDFGVAGRMWLDQEILLGRFLGNWHLVYRDVTGSVNERTSISTVIPQRPSVHSLILLQGANAVEASLISSTMNSFIYDYLARQKIAGNHFNQTIWSQIPLIPFATIQSYAKNSFVLLLSCELLFSAWDMELFAREVGYDGPPFHWDEERRFL
ncbi:N-6 DNA methylase, partial [Mariniblastus sp.]|nr:N-6 DNA methylase [Mariniblastus sp.]